MSKGTWIICLLLLAFLVGGIFSIQSSCERASRYKQAKTVAEKEMSEKKSGIIRGAY